MKGLIDNKSLRAYKKVEEIKKFYWFLGSAVFVSLLFFGMAYLFALFGAPAFLIWMMLAMPLIFVIVLIVEYIRVFDKNLIFGKKW